MLCQEGRQETAHAALGTQLSSLASLWIEPTIASAAPLFTTDAFPMMFRQVISAAGRHHIVPCECLLYRLSEADMTQAANMWYVMIFLHAAGPVH